MSSRSLTDLHVAFQPKAQEFITATSQAGLDVLIYCTLRSLAEQAELYACGRTLPGKIVTKAQPGQSAHNYGLAFDGAPLIQGRIAWDDHGAWQTYGRIAAELGLEWAGTWVSFKEFPHIQLPNWKQYTGGASA